MDIQSGCRKIPPNYKRYSIFVYFENEYDLKDSLGIFMKIYNKHMNTSTKYSPNEVFLGHYIYLKKVNII